MPLSIALAKHARTSPTRRSLGINSIMLYIIDDDLIAILSSWGKKEEEEGVMSMDDRKR